jgi:hypothetical protein
MLASPTVWSRAPHDLVGSTTRYVTGAFVFFGVTFEVGAVTFEVGAVTFEVGAVTFEVGAVTFEVGPVPFFAGRASPLAGAWHLLIVSIRPVAAREIDLGGKVGYRRHRVAPRAERGVAMGSAGVHKDARDARRCWAPSIRRRTLPHASRAVFATCPSGNRQGYDGVRRSPSRHAAKRTPASSPSD